ncbi:hypothetical protein C8F04DRAFT_1391871 [Mycena alexandri]|uniref:Uncharacterized protein n=1 Tax=Mycena alexandri TaxID=1745969 RepID=A0AAD6T7Q3_9AGAR|nr:hypothetical protein C8F04DRAFT_1391871 [Mycena alexandri]
MSSTLSHDSPRSWWSLAQKSPSPAPDFPSEKPHSHSKQSGIKFNTLATAMGFKPKKSHPPPLTLRPTIATATPTTTLLAPRMEPHMRRPNTAPSVGIGRAPSNSVSSSRSRPDSIEPSTPKTPDDLPQSRRGSLLTLSDSDPFAARVVSLHSPSDPNRLSAFSNSSVNETKSNELVNRVSYASSSSQSFRLGGDLSPLSILSPASEAGSPYMRLSNKISGHSLRRKNDETWLSNLGAESNRFSQPDPPPKPRPVMRARGMTDAGIEQRTNFLRSDPFISRSPKSSSTGYQASSPSLPARQISLSRPAPPPIHDLPPPPTSADDRVQGRHSAGTASTSSLTFSSEFSPISPRAKGKQQAYDASPKADESGWEPEAPRHRTLKKAISHQSLKRNQSSSSMSIPGPSTAPLPDIAPLKVRKQRSFHQPRLPVPAVPLQFPLSEQRTPDSAQSTRKRLFSASSSRRPSQSTLALADDPRPATSPAELTQSISCWIDTDQPPSSPSMSAHEYTPQQIMSPAEMLQVEASVDAAYQRPRTGSILSARSALSDFETDFGLSPSSTFGGGRKRSTSVRSNATSMTEGHEYYAQSLAPQPPSPPILMSLPPPPRRPARPSISRSQSDVVHTPLSPPPRKNVRPKISVEERMHRHSIMKKSSFLNFEDETDKDPPHRSLPTKASFLDLTRGSFDSMRSDDSD